MAFSGRHEPNLRTTHAAVHIYVGDDLMSRVFLGPGGETGMGEKEEWGVGVGGGGWGNAASRMDLQLRARVIFSSDFRWNIHYRN